jgi:hypothetical protein
MVRTGMPGSRHKAESSPDGQNDADGRKALEGGRMFHNRGMTATPSQHPVPRSVEMAGCISAGQWLRGKSTRCQIDDANFLFRFGID